jgi:hypothetical protein
MTFRPALLAVLLATVASALPGLAAPAAAAPNPAATAFDTVKALAGTWRPADKPASPLRIRFATTAGGTTVTEEWLRGAAPHSLTVYHRDGATLVATHYCPQGNQPRLALVPAAAAGTAAGAPVGFAFRDATDLDPATESHLVALSFALGADGVLVRRETYRQGGAEEASELRLVRER